VRRTKQLPLVFVIVALACASRATDVPLDPQLGELEEAIPQTQSDRIGLTVEMGNSLAGFARARDFQRAPGPVRWSPWEGYCCDQGARTRTCLTVDASGLSACRNRGKLALTCKRLEGCTGSECFCCSHGLEHACGLDEVREEKRPEVGPTKKRAAPSIWSPE
jgi:hypothetical protein